MRPFKVISAEESTRFRIGASVHGTNNSVAEVLRVRLSWEAAPQPVLPRPGAGLE